MALQGRTLRFDQVPRTAGIGASRPLWRIPANVSFLKHSRHSALSAGTAFMPQSRPSRRGPKSAGVGLEAVIS